MKKLLVVFILSLFSFSSFAQTELLVKTNEKGAYITHTVSPKQTFYSIGRQYHVAPKDLATFNGIDMAGGLNIGQTILIPLSGANFTQTTQKGTPVYYQVGEGEGLYRVSVNNGKVLMADLRKWNKLASDKIAPGQKLIVGYLNADAPVETAIAEVKEAAPQIEAKVEEPPVVTKKAEAEKQPSTPAQQATVQQPRQTAVTDAKGGYFASAYEQQARSTAAKKEQTATSGIFKTASGWQDAKYYALMDGVEPGTIVRVINPTNSKTVYAKVLGAMSGISQNKGLDVRISNAAANVLQVTDTDKFIVKVDY